MSEEEKKAISQCRLLLEGEITLHVIGDDGGTDYCGKVNKAYNEDLKTVLDLVEKQQKEIEELKQNRDDYKEEYIKLQNARYYNYISEDKIREKIKKYQEKAEDVKQKYKGVYAYKDDYLEALAKIEGYQELLEEK